MAPAPESAPDSVAVKFDIKETVEAKDEINQAKEENEGKNQNQSTGTLPDKPVRLYVNREDQHLGHLEVYSYDHVGLLFKICELLTSHGVDICSAQINTENGVVYNHFDVRIARPSDTAACVEWCRELEELLEKTRGPAFDNSLANVSKRLSVNPDLVSVVTFVEKPPQRDELCYKLVLEGINQAGLLTYTALVLYRCGFSISTAQISTTEGHIVDTFELTTTSAESESLLRSYLDVPMPMKEGQQNTKEVMPLPFHATESDADLQALMQMWRTQGGSGTQMSLLEDSGSLSRVNSLGEIAEECSSKDRLSRAPSFSSDTEQPSGGAAQDAAQDKGLTRKMSVQFVNGDVYTGNCKQFPEGEKRHGIGTYVYSSGTHDVYKQYHGQWQEDKKHGYGVLFYRNGGVYVGQWMNNQKHGLGVLLDSNSQEPAGMPTYRYEGLWKEDHQHGLGVEERDYESYFGNFSNGSRAGRGVKMNLAKAVASNEVLDANSRPKPFYEALEQELDELYKIEDLQRKSSPAMSNQDSWRSALASSATMPNSATFHFGQFQDAGTRTSLADLAFSEAPPANGNISPGENESGSTSTASAKRSTPLPMSIPRNGSNNDFGTPATPALQAGAASFGGGTFIGQRISSPGTSMGSMGHQTPLQYGPGPTASEPRSSSESTGQRLSPGASGHADGCFVFAMHEENDFISPQESRLERRIRDQLDPGDTSGVVQRLHLSRGAAGSGAGSSSSHGRYQSQDLHAADLAKKAAKRHPFRRSAMLWTEDELAAFMSCLGLSPDVSHRVMRQQFKGAAQFLSMTNVQLRKALGLVTPVERLVVRNALKRLLDGTRLEASVCSVKAMDIISDSVLSHYIIPKEELTMVSKISQGGYGTVYRGVLEPKVDRAGGAFQARRTHLVAVKDMKGDRRVQLYELLKEACVMASLSHPNICTFVGVCTDNVQRKYFIISELMDCSLFDMIHQPYKLRWHGELTVSLSLSLGTGIISGICYIHQKNLVHADLKSSNILIDYTSSSRQPIPRICDFGHAAVRCHPSPHHRCGTPHWAAPEVLRSEALGPAADIYSFGVMMWEMLTQKLPHKDMSFGQVLASVGWAGWTPDMSQLPELPREVARIIKECLRFAPSDRPPGKDVVNRLKRFPKQVRMKTLKLLASFLGHEL